MVKDLYSLTQTQAERAVVASVTHYKKIWHIPKRELKKRIRTTGVSIRIYTTKIESETFPVGLNKDIVRKNIRKRERTKVDD